MQNSHDILKSILEEYPDLASKQSEILALIESGESIRSSIQIDSDFRDGLRRDLLDAEYLYYDSSKSWIQKIFKSSFFRYGFAPAFASICIVSLGYFGFHSLQKPISPSYREPDIYTPQKTPDISERMYLDSEDPESMKSMNDVETLKKENKDHLDNQIQLSGKQIETNTIQSQNGEGQSSGQPQTPPHHNDDVCELGNPVCMDKSKNTPKTTLPEDEQPKLPIYQNGADTTSSPTSRVTSPSQKGGASNHDQEVNSIENIQENSTYIEDSPCPENPDHCGYGAASIDDDSPAVSSEAEIRTNAFSAFCMKHHGIFYHHSYDVSVKDRCEIGNKICLQDSFNQADNTCSWQRKTK